MWYPRLNPCHSLGIRRYKDIRRCSKCGIKGHIEVDSRVWEEDLEVWELDFHILHIKEEVQDFRDHIGRVGNVEVMII